METGTISAANPIMTAIAVNDAPGDPTGNLISDCTNTAATTARIGTANASFSGRPNDGGLQARTEVVAGDTA